MAPISLDEVREQHDRSAGPYHEFIREPSMSLGRYVLPAGGTDPQSPHAEDEVYYVLDGRARIQIADEEYPVEPGDVVFVGKGTEHRFVDIAERLELLVVFAPAEGSLTENA
jgi:mannose-6-phosphate isomerase-like protein (cupin superfamily)